jgi:3-hydroxybutyryl-CoA dehydrogenase
MNDTKFTSSSIQHITVIGAGLMGHGIAQVFAQKNYPVILYDLNRSLLEKALCQIRSNLETFVEAGFEAEERVEKILSNLRISVDFGEAVEKADFVLEAVTEELMLKIDLFEKLDQSCSDKTILASNTSTLPLSEINSKVKRKERMVITHWFNPPYIIPTVEVVRGETTAQEVFESTFQLLEKIGKKPVRILKDIPGFLVNRVQTTMFREILSLLDQGVASAEDLDAAIRGSFGIRSAVLGPLTTMDMGGLDVLYKGLKHLYPILDRSTEVQKSLEEKIERGEFGLKSGKGFFQYQQGEDLAPSNLTKERDRKLLSLLKALSKEA